MMLGDNIIRFLVQLLPLILASFTWSATALSMSSTTSTDLSQRLSLGGNAMRNLVSEAALHDVTESLDVKGIQWLEHINLVVGSKQLAEILYLEFLGFTRDAGKSFHVNLGQQQFHLAENELPAQRIAGSVGLVVPSLETLRERVPEAQEKLKGTSFAILSDQHDCITIRCPWGNTYHVYSSSQDTLESTLNTPRKMENLHAKGGAYDPHRMAIRGNPGIRYIEIASPKGKTSAIARFYREMLGCTVMQVKQDSVHAAVVCVGPGVHLAFVENDQLSQQDVKDMEGVHICVYTQDFEALYHRLASHSLIWTNPRFVHLDTCDTWQEAAASRTLRFKHVIDLDTSEPILELEHETRPLRHGQYMKVPKYEPM